MIEETAERDPKQRHVWMGFFGILHGHGAQRIPLISPPLPLLFCVDTVYPAVFVYLCGHFMSTPDE